MIQVKEIFVAKMQDATNGKINSRVITFILKSGNEIKCQEDKIKGNLQQSAYESGKNYLQTVCVPCGNCYGINLEKSMDVTI